MKLPNGDQAVIDIAGKLLGYCLNMEHGRGRHKARVFASTLGITSGNPATLVDALLDAARNSEAILRKSNEYGDEYVIEFSMEGPNGRFVITSSWFIDTEKTAPRLTNCYVNLRKSNKG